MSWKKLQYEQSQGLRSELDTINGWSQGRSVESMYPKVMKPEDFFGSELKTPGFKEVAEFLKNKSTLNVLEVGAGIGRMSVFLASLGHQVSVLEPAAEQCRILDHFATKWNLPITVYEGTGEIAEQIQDKFALIVFNGALHHCDDAVKSLENCRKLLKP